ncbi:hypothetical protein ACNI3Q_09135 [Sphingomonas sp. FW199]|uniref:hypothetical protein n=1 Tax=Sphingomonas sp. FW199 TaxID=3400217 RepID=UPI003CF38FB5
MILPVWLGQSLAAFAALGGLTMLPPAEGAMLIIPMDSRDVTGPAMDGGAALVDLGPLPGSIIVHGRLDRIAGSVGHALILRAPRAGCGVPQ